MSSHVMSCRVQSIHTKTSQVKRSHSMSSSAAFNRIESRQATSSQIESPRVDSRPTSPDPPRDSTRPQPAPRLTPAPSTRSGETTPTVPKCRDVHRLRVGGHSHLAAFGSLADCTHVGIPVGFPFCVWRLCIDGFGSGDLDVGYSVGG